MIHAWITKENINKLIIENGFSDEIDMLSLDKDGVDYWIWKAINCIHPRVVEYNNRWDAEASVTVPYHADFVHTPLGYFGASLRAFVRLGEKKEYRLVGCNRQNTNAFFIREGIAEDIFPVISVSACLTSPFAKHQCENQSIEAKSLEWIEIS